MKKTMYEVNWHHDGDSFSHCTVTAITVLREGVLPGCIGVSITGEDSSGRRFQGSPENYYGTEDAAWAEVKKTLEVSIGSLEKWGAATLAEADAMREYLAKLNK